MSKITRDDTDRFFDYDINIPARTIYMGSSVNDDGDEHGVNALMAERVIKGLLILDRTEGDITIIMNNPGGDEYHGMAIYDVIKACKSHVTIKVFGHAMSMGSIILQAADERVLSPNSKVMIHYGTPILASPDDHAKTNHKWAEECKKFCKFMDELYLDKIKQKHPGFSKRKLQEMLNFDTILSAQEAVDLGLADKVL